MALEAGTLIARRYALQAPLDRGAMGALWVASDSQTGRRVALKFVDRPYASEDAVRRFQREARALQQLHHPSVVRLIDHGAEAGTPFIAMELLEGESLRSLLKRRHPLPPLEVVDLLQQAASGLEAAHAVGIVHRDIKPSNLFVCSAGSPRVKVVDFGIAGGELLEGSTSQSMTRGLIGSPAYMSPEQARGEPLDPMADVWALAVVAFEALTGREPFAGANIPDTLQRICSEEIPRASSLALGLPLAIDAFFARAFAADRRQRFQSARELIAGLQRVFEVVDTARSSVTPIAGRNAPVETLIRHSDEEHLLAWFDNVQLILSLVPPSYEFMVRISEELEALARHVGRGTGALLVIRAECPAPDEKARAYIKRELSRSSMLAAAQVVEGTGFRAAAMRSALSMIQLAIRPRYPMKIFSDASAGAAWLSAELGKRAGHAPDAGRLAKAAHELRVRFKGFILP